ncbi:hypothetical protein [Enterococcus entomosocium]|uniref:hypothetical protein n=1 Tax=Enterococcus entomosocium TaxID=3034352 RepID=UPI0026473403|nr:hypothetical protein [Enterococcus entomosocium]
MLYRINLYISSYLPLYLLLLYKGVYEYQNDCNNRISLCLVLVYCTVLIILSIIGILTIAYFIFKKTNRTEPTKGTFNSTGDNIISYIMTYLSPMLSIELQDTSSLVINLSLFFLIGILYVKNNLIYLNPVLLLFGLYIYEWENAGTTRIVITNLELSELNAYFKENKSINARKFGKDVWLYKK